MVNLLAAAALAAATPPSTPAMLSSPPPASPAMFVVRDADTTIYIFGTFHALDGRSQWFGKQVRDAFDLMMLRIQKRAPQAHLRGAYVEKMGERGREVILGMTRDPQFGPMLMFGLGGIFVEVMKDVTFHLAPITADEAMQMLKGTRSYALLQGARGQAPVDLEAIASALQRISQLATDYPEILELDINPFIVGPVGMQPYVADARMTLSTVSEHHD